MKGVGVFVEIYRGFSGSQKILAEQYELTKSVREKFQLHKDTT